MATTLDPTFRTNDPAKRRELRDSVSFLNRRICNMKDNTALVDVWGRPLYAEGHGGGKQNFTIIRPVRGVLDLTYTPYTSDAGGLYLEDRMGMQVSPRDNFVDLDFFEILSRTVSRAHRFYRVYRRPGEK